MMENDHKTRTAMNNGEAEKSEEPLGSLTQPECNSPGNSTILLRSSARVSKKLRLDSLSATKMNSPNPSTDKKDGVKEEWDFSKKLESKGKKIKSHNWSAQGKDIFFEALNEYGKDFDAIQRYFVLKSKKKSASELVMKTKEQIRHFYYRTWAKISKHLKFPPDIKKQTQELYGLINYGEFRKKLGCINEKNSLKLNELIIKGFTQLKVKGKNVQIRTPRCRTLRRLNQLEECQDEIKLPSRIHVELVPRNNESWARVQCTAQNPRVQVIVPLQYRLTNLLQYLQKKWMPRHSKYKNKIMNTCQVFVGNGSCEEVGESLMVAPKPDAEIHISDINLSQYLTSTRICLSSHEKRLGKSGTCEEILKSLQAESRGKGKKQQKFEEKEVKKCGEKCSPEGKKSEEETSFKAEEGKVNGKMEECKANLKILSGEEKEGKSSDTDLLSPDLSNDEKPNFAFGVLEHASPNDLNEDCNDVCNQADIFDEVRQNNKNEKMPDFLESLLKIQNKDEAVGKVRSGWSLENSRSLAIGDLYLMFGSDYKLQLEYWWKKKDSVSEKGGEVNLDELSSMLSKLVRLTKLLKRNCRQSCPCGHVCGDENKSSGRGRRPVNESFNEKSANENSKELISSSNNRSNLHAGEPIFRKLNVHPSNKSRLDPEAFKAQLDKLTPRYCNRRGRGIAAKNVVVQRTLPLLPKANNGHAILTLKLIPQTSQFSGDQLMPVSLTMSAPNSEKCPSEATRRRSEQPIAPKPVPAPSEGECGPPPHPFSPTPSTSALLEDHDPMINLATSDNNLTALSGNFEYSGLPPASPSPTVILREEDWLNAEVADYSLTSILGHLETPVKNTNCHGYDSSAEVETQLQCLMTESSIDYMAKFADLAAKFSSDHNQ